MHQVTLRVLMVLGSGEATGGSILQGLAGDVAGRAPSLPALYRSLRDALERGWVEVVFVQEHGGQGRPGQVYRITPAGRRAARDEAKQLQKLAAAVLDSHGRSRS